MNQPSEKRHEAPHDPLPFGAGLEEEPKRAAQPRTKRRGQRGPERQQTEQARADEPASPSEPLSPDELPFGAGALDDLQPPARKKRRRRGRRGSGEARETPEVQEAAAAEPQPAPEQPSEPEPPRRVRTRTRKAQPPEDAAPTEQPAESKPPGERRVRTRKAQPPEDTAPQAPSPDEPPAPIPQPKAKRGVHRVPKSTAPEPGERISVFKGFTLSAFQLKAVEAIRRGENLLVSAPTGAGKTLVAEFAIDEAVRRGRRVIYTAPIKALSNQKYRDFRDDPNVDVGLMTGDVTIRSEAQVVIMTTEILRNQIFESPAFLHDVDYVIFDEVHFMDDLERGTVWEESLIFAPDSIKFVCLSATIDNLDQLGAWIRELRTQDLTVVRENKRPVPLKHRLYTEKSGRFDLGRLKNVAKHELEIEKHDRAKEKRKQGGRRGRDRDRGRRPFRQPPDIRPLLDELQDEGMLPVLVFSFSRKDTERLAFRARNRDLLNEEEHARMEALQRELIEAYQLDEKELVGEIFQLARLGIGYHHAGMLPINKELVERMFTSGLLKMIFTTETFAIGINMPARTVVFANLKKFDGISMDYMRTRDYLQMAGRAGRQGIDKEGLVVSLLGPRDLADAPIQRLFEGNPEPVQSRFRLAYSTLLHLVAHMGRDHIHLAWDKSFNQYQHRSSSKKAREHNRIEQRKVVDAHLDFLEELGYFLPQGEEHGRGGLTERGRLARSIYGYEIQVTELLFRGVLENLPPKALAIVFTALVFEDRRRDPAPRLPERIWGDVRKQVDRLISQMAKVEARFGIPSPMRTADWGMTRPLLDWMRGASLEEIEERMETGAGDFVRTLRMTVQLMRNVRRAVDPTWDVHHRLEEALQLLNRDEVDAARQLELG
ncbi:MAG: DEAD/DEAH box helicase [Planctomycetota bacterium]|nr:DEAD/DEAH box helicase [Planctomycetota bacterium]